MQHQAAAAYNNALSGLIQPPSPHRTAAAVAALSQSHLMQTPPSTQSKSWRKGHWFIIEIFYFIFFSAVEIVVVEILLSHLFSRLPDHLSTNYLIKLIYICTKLCLLRRRNLVSIYYSIFGYASRTIDERIFPDNNYGEKSFFDERVSSDKIWWRKISGANFFRMRKFLVTSKDDFFLFGLFVNFFNQKNLVPNFWSGLYFIILRRFI